LFEPWDRGGMQGKNDVLGAFVPENGGNPVKDE
jgi:hypothetical protein